MDGTQVSSSSTLLENGMEISVKIEKPDSDRRSDKVLQFALALQRCSEKAPITIHEQSRRGKSQVKIDFVDLTLSSDDEDDGPSRSTATSTLPTQVNGNPMGQDGEEELSRDTDIMDTSQAGACEGQPEADEHLDAVNSTTFEEDDEMDYEFAMSTVEVRMDDEEGEVNGVNTMFKHPNHSRARWGWGNTLPYTPEQKQMALDGNPLFDYRTKLGPNGEETYAIYKCSKCPTGFPRMHHYLIHMRGHDATNPNLNYPCKECDFRSVNSHLLAHHMERHRLQWEPDTFVNMCGRGRASTEPGTVTRKRRSESASPERTVKQPVANSPVGHSTSAPRSPIVEPPAEDVGDESAQRAEARKGNPDIVYRVYKRYRPNGQVYQRSTYKCQMCPYNHENFESYKKHIEGHTGVGEFLCNLCTFSASTHVNLERHLFVHRNQEQPVPLAEDGSGVAGKAAGSRQSFPNRTWKHANGVTEMRRNSLPTGTTLTAVQCPKCPSKFNGTGNLNIHLKQHGKVGMRLRCPYCDYSSNREDYMRNHVAVHTEQNGILTPGPPTGREPSTSPKPSTSTSPIPGPISPSKVSVPGNVSEEAIARMIKGNPRFTYMEKSTNGFPLPLESSYKCWHCPYATVKYNSFLGHQQCHDANAKYACSKCSYSAKTMQGLKNHDLAHTIQHANRHNTTSANSLPNVQQSSAASTEEGVVTSEADTSIPFAPPMTPPAEPGTLGRNGSGQFFITNIKIQNVMPMNEEPTVADVSTHGILKLKGKSEEGKSSYILAVMLGLGYDLCLDYKDSTTSICGLNLKNVISHGKDFASIELTLSLRSFPELQKEFGSQLKFSRRINRTQSELSNVLVASSADPRPQFKSIRPKVLGGKDLKEFLQKLKLTPERMRLMLLDGENVKYFMDNSNLWYGLFLTAVDDSGIDVVQRITETKFLLQRLQGEQQLQQERLEVFKARLQERPPLDSEKIRQVKEEDWLNHSKCTADINQLAQEKRDLQKKLGEFVVQTNDGTEGFVLRMRTMFNKFLHEFNYSGEIIVSNKSKDMSICIWKIDSSDVPPRTMDEVKEVWKSMSNGRRRIAVIGLYLALWEISNYLGILAADAYSCTEADFQVPPSGLPILWELLNRKCLEQKQCIISLPPEY